MANLNSLAFSKLKVDETKITEKMSKIMQEFDIPKNIKPYIFKVLYIHKYSTKTNLYTCYLAPTINSNLPIIKAQLPVELIYTHKIIGGYDYERNLEPNENYIVKERNFRLIDDINKGNKRYYLVCYGYLVNRYKNDDANTTRPDGVQEFAFTETYGKKLKDRSYMSYYIYTKNLDKALKIYLTAKIPNIEFNPDKLNELIYNSKKVLKFVKAPKDFLKEK